MDYRAAAVQLKENLRLRTEPFGVSFLKEAAALPPKTRQPSKVFGKKVTICQGVTMTRVYGWPVGLTRDDLLCVPGMLAFGFTPAADPIMELGQLFCEAGFHRDLGPSLKEVEALPRFEPQEIEAIYLCPLERLAQNPDVVVVYGNPAQLMRLIQAATFSLGARVTGEFGGKVECTEYLIAPYRTGEIRVAIPGMGDRIFSMTQDDEMVMAFPGKLLDGLLVGLKDAAKKIGARYPITVYQNFSPSFPPNYEERAKKWGIL
ncbi:MAG: DUF169 domain-containing protein [Syntrophobacterales bacterium]|jgi:uncharacterized protein (DUF169 family)|nr:DUF169 domain-containing protein [Syntrophobacterales bacterium]